MQDSTNRATTRIAALNDALRRSLTGGKVLMTTGVQNLDADTQTQLVRLVQTHSTWDDGNDPYGEHDFGAIELDGRRFFWKIDYYDLSLENSSPDPTDSAQTTRVLTLMLASEY